MAIPSFVLSYVLRTRTITCHYLKSEHDRVYQRRLRLGSEDTFWKWLSRGSVELRRRLQDSSSADRGPSLDMFVRAASRHEGGERPNDTRWKGGWVGWWGYEMKEESLGGYERRKTDARSGHGGGPDACWGWCDRILRKSKGGSWNICGVVEQGGPDPVSPLDSTEDNDEESLEMVDWLEGLDLRFGASAAEWQRWTDTARKVVEAAINGDSRLPEHSNVLPVFKPLISADDYMRGIEKCREAIYAGNSYELTLTTRFVSTSPSAGVGKDPLDMYAHLRRRNPAPYSTFVHFPTVGKTILSSSPERFVRIDGDGRVEMKPIKGTRGRVKCACDKQGVTCPGKGGSDCGALCAKMDDEVAQELCSNAKERAENLMVSHRSFDWKENCC